ncbi:prolyl oligopeptidase family serine peptidase [Pelagicoccus sp. SDUM812003]|uniref:alpha/beta hydrolase family protein n=1 Tax=Pelagicoccus sp. SDUM812003 TaxID=3041267 RepID=UPI00280F5BFF|nr:prolyl oligopeptidase family serine peptidase [Pelagicoccus sp. SDUM812003]MDQ8204815.1 prolyl oligopeptidase family serine peptidase [Pelagicoccus sp. SDUM812003]
MRPPLVTLALFLVVSSFAAPSQDRLAEMIDDFFRDPETVGFQVAPGGRCLSYGEYLDKSRRSLMTVDLEKGESRGLAAGPGQDIYSQGWVSENRLIGVKLGLSGNRILGVFSAEPLFNDIRNLDDGLERLPRVLHTMPHDPEYCAVIDRRVRTRFPDVRYMNVITGELVSRVKNPGRGIRFFLDTLGRPRVVKCLGEKEGESTWMYRSGEDDSDWVELELSRRIEDWHFFDAGATAFAEVHDDERVFVQLFDFESGQLVRDPIKSELCDVTVDGFMTDPTSLGLYGIRIDEPMPRVVWFDAGLKQLAEQLETSLPGANVSFLGVNSVNQSIFFRSASDIDPGTYFELTKDGQVKRIAQINSRLANYDLARTRPISFVNREGQEIRGYLTLPPGREKGVPLLVDPHGGPHAQDKWGFRARNQFYAQNGIAVLNINYRGSSGRGRAFWLQDGFVSILERSVDDVIDATKWAMEQGIADPKRIAISGGSFGGYIAVESAARAPELFRCSVGFAGVYDWHRQLLASRRDDRYGWDWFLEDEIGDLKGNKKEYQKYSPIFYAERIQAPVLLVHGASDDRVEVGQSKALHKALLKAGKTSELVVDSWGRHGFIDEERRVDFYTKEFEFISKYVLRN